MSVTEGNGYVINVFREDVTQRELGFSLNHLRILTGPVCWTCWEDHDRITVATEEHCSTALCSECYDAAAERAWERSCEDYYGGSTPQTDAERAEVERQERVR